MDIIDKWYSFPKEMHRTDVRYIPIYHVCLVYLEPENGESLVVECRDVSIEND